MIKTGFQIIAGLPIEEQTNLDLSDLPEAFLNVLRDGNYKDTAFLMACKQLYRWTGEKWEAQDGD